MMNFYVLKNPEDAEGFARTDFLQAPPVHSGKAPRCPSCGKYIGMIPWLPPNRAELEVWGTEFGDIAFGPGDEMLVSERFVELYDSNDLSGLGGFNDVEVVRVNWRGVPCSGIVPPNYYCVTIARSRAAIDTEASGLVLRDPLTCDECRQGFIIRSLRVVIEENTWSGEDIFFARGLPGIVLASQRFSRFFDENSIKNGALIPASEYGFDFYPAQKASG